VNGPMDELRDYFTDRLSWLGVQYPDRAVTELLSRVEKYATDRAAAELRAAADDIPRFSPAIIAKWLRDRSAALDGAA